MAEVIVMMEVGSNGVALITISNSPVNALAVPSKNGRFYGGFGMNVFQKVHKKGEISQLPYLDAKKPIVAVVQGLALNGGLELAMVCSFWMPCPCCSSKSSTCLPELSLGVIPGFGGTQRLPRLLGLSKAIDMMLTSKPIISEEGAKLGLIDAIVPPQELLKVARKWALDIAEARKPWVRSLHRTDKIGSLSEAREIINGVLKSSKKRGLSLEEKTEKMLQIFYDSHDFYLLRELENLGPRKGVISQSVKDVVQTLMDDDLVSKDKIETSLRNVSKKLDSELEINNKTHLQLVEKKGRHDSRRRLKLPMKQQTDAHEAANRWTGQWCSNNFPQRNIFTLRRLSLP
ncbi:hypothetical protein L2E82_18349 [Cichorium intybus]|uniref:Uncharacterized protein n=1 Tax=Cichorium intybus TaxID=13427 RepID=A0ACB9FAE5_CICIN|nr:hypothetical protein L2E82_18349 [Cichorium intybus]